MLYEIYCQEFSQKRIKFKSGLNVVLGTNMGDNSIGKSTFLMIVDFVFGGDTYANSKDIQKNLPKHDIYFSFKTNEEYYYFCRNNINADIVWKCDETNRKIYEMSIKEYRDWLAKFYQLLLPDLSFRDAVGRYMRIYGKENLNENHPLNYVARENDIKASYALLKLFNYYSPIAELERQFEKSNDALKIYKKAQNLSFIDRITKTQYNQNNKKLSEIKNELNDLLKQNDSGLVDVDLIVSEQALKLKKELQNMRRIRGIINSQLNVVEENYDYKFALSSKDIEELNKFFPNVNLRKLDEIQKFHKQISSIFKNEVKNEKQRLTNELLCINKKIQEFENELRDIIKVPNVSRVTLKKHVELTKQIEKLEKENNAYEKLQLLQNIKDNDFNKLKSLESQQFAKIANLINSEMKKINEFIYAGEYNSPIINFKENSYDFFTPDDVGTGIAYKGLVVFDLAVIHLTKLPVLIHDSIILKQISDKAVEKLLELYENCGKQVIISLDKQNSYTEKGIDFLQKKRILELGTNEKTLFGKSWGNIKNSI